VKFQQGKALVHDKSHHLVSSTRLKHYQRLLSSLSLIGAKISKLLLLSGRPEQSTNRTTFMIRTIKTTGCVLRLRRMVSKQFAQGISRNIRVHQGLYEFIKDRKMAKKHRVTIWAVTKPKSTNPLLNSNPNFFFKTL